MIFITRWNRKTMISIFLFTFYIINQICIIILYQIRLVFLIFEFKYCITEVLEQPGGGTPALNRPWRYATNVTQTSVNKNRYWLTPTLLHLTARPQAHDWQMFFIEKWTATRMLGSSKAIAIRKHPWPLHAHTHHHHTPKSVRWFHIRYSYTS